MNEHHELPDDVADAVAVVLLDIQERMPTRQKPPARPSGRRRTPKGHIRLVDPPSEKSKAA